jgi:hypothetical protein
MFLAVAYKIVYDGISYVHRLWEAIMPQEYGDDRLVFQLCSEDAVELSHLGDGFAGLARHFHRHLEEEGVDPNDVPSKLFVTKLNSGSIEFELATLASFYGHLEKCGVFVSLGV